MKGKVKETIFSECKPKILPNDEADRAAPIIKVSTAPMRAGKLSGVYSADQPSLTISKSEIKKEVR